MAPTGTSGVGEPVNGRYAIQEPGKTLYLRAAARLRELLRDGTFPPGSRLPSEAELGVMLGVSRATIREALRICSNEGLVVQRHGVGTFATSQPLVENGLEELESFDRLAARHGWVCGTRGVSLLQRPAGDLAGKLGVGASAPVNEVRGVRTANGRPIGYMVDFVPESVLPLGEIQERFSGSILDLILARGEPEIAYCWSDLAPTLATPSLADALETPRRAPLLYISESLRGRDNQPFEFSEAWYMAEYVRFHLIRRVRRELDGTPGSAR